MVCGRGNIRSMILSKVDIENLAKSVLNDFRYSTGIYTSFTPIDQLASDYLGLTVRFETLSDDMSFCGVTAYDDTRLKVEVDGMKRVIEIKRNEIILNLEFLKASKIQSLCGRRRFTLAHEVAHQILFALETQERKAHCRKIYSTRTTHSIRQLKTAEDWNEWQADYLGAALLMPKDGVTIFLRDLAYGNIDTYPWDEREEFDYAIGMFCTYFGVSKSAAIIRLKNLGYLSHVTCGNGEVKYA